MTSSPVDSPPPSPSRGVIALHASSDHDWQPILHSSNQVVLYNPKSHALSISHSSSNGPPIHGKTCPFCKTVLPKGFEPDTPGHNDFDDDPSHHSRKPDYFQLLSVANESASGPPPLTAREGDVEGEARDDGSSRAFPPNTMAEGYFKRFFQEEYKLGMGANGSVYLCQHMLDGNPLGHFAVKRIAVGESHSYLLNILREVRLLERLIHPNIITYHHAWLENYQFSPFGPQVPTLHVLMQWAEGGSLDDFIDIRLGRGSPHVHINPFGAFPSSPNPATSTASAQPPLSRVTTNDFVPVGSDTHSRSARIRAFRAYQRATPEEKERMRHETLVANGRGPGRRAQSLKAVHLLSADEVKGLFRDVVEGLNFLHSRSILHLDLKPGNVLLTWDEGQLIPRAMLSDFGTSRDMIASNSVRSGNTGTLEYSSPESLPSPQTGLLREINSKSDMWSLGMILHKLLFFKLPYRYAADGDNDIPLSGAQPTERQSRLGEGEKLKRLEQEVLDYPGFKSTTDLATAFEARRLPRNFLILLEGLLNKVPNTRPSCERVSIAIKEGKLDPLKQYSKQSGSSSLVPLARSVLGTDGRTSPLPNIEPDSEVEDLPLEHDEPTVSDVSNADLGQTLSRKSTLLGLPSPSDSLNSMDSRQNSTQARSVRLRWARKILSVMVKHREILGRLVKNSVLVAKVLSISTMCPGPYGFPRTWVSSMLVGAALADVVVDMRLLAHIGLLVFHILVVKIGCTYGRCCV